MNRLPKNRSLYYGGRWHESAAQKSIPVIAPATGEALGNVVDASADDVDRAVKSARDAFRAWRDTPAQERAKAVRRAAQLARKSGDGHRALALEGRAEPIFAHGKNLGAGVEGDVKRDGP